MSAFATFSGAAAQFQGMALGERAIVRVKGGENTEVTDATVFRENLQARATDGNQRLEWPLSVQIPKASYPGGVVTIGADVVAVKVRTSDVALTEKTVSGILSEAGGMWHLGLD